MVPLVAILAVPAAVAGMAKAALWADRLVTRGVVRMRCYRTGVPFESIQHVPMYVDNDVIEAVSQEMAEETSEAARALKLGRWINEGE